MNTGAASNESYKNRVREFRIGRDLSQAALGKRAGVTRQTVSALENQRYSPNINVALRLARALGCRVEELFPLPQEEEREVELVGERDSLTGRVSLAQVRERLLAYPLGADSAIQEGFASADGVIAELASRRVGTRARLLIPSEQLQSTALLVGCDPAAGILSAHVARHSDRVRLAWKFASSRAALDAVERGQAHIGGSHLQGSGGDYIVGEARRVLSDSGGLVVGFAGWEQGFVVQPSNPKAIRVLEDLARPDVWIVNRQTGSGCRELLDERLSEARISPVEVQGYERVASSHLAVARAVASGGADVGVALRATALACGLDFVPISDVRFDLIIPQDITEHPAVSAMLEVMQSRALREDIQALPGYDVSMMGAVIAQIPIST
ncbi:MAG: helix-turn-helix domain-containing protein [Chloroflexi bacterium]|nr:helix-turn-helix domain-containing protein [Chloroflexota bacterium]